MIGQWWDALGTLSALGPWLGDTRDDGDGDDLDGVAAVLLVVGDDETCDASDTSRFPFLGNFAYDASDCWLEREICPKFLFFAAR